MKVTTKVTTATEPTSRCRRTGYGMVLLVAAASGWHGDVQVGTTSTLPTTMQLGLRSKPAANLRLKQPCAGP